jgi:hypothetical protein
MEKLCILALVSVLFLVPTAIAARTQDGSEDWGYVEVRPSKQFSPNFHSLLHLFSSLILVLHQKMSCEFGVHGSFALFDSVSQKPTCSGGFIEVLTELKIPQSHGQSFSGSKVDL